MKTLVVYYSWTNGNTERIAQQVQKELDADIAAIVPVIPYPEDYDTTVAQGKREVEQGILPEIENIDISDYDAIVVGTPTWWYTMAPVVATFLKKNDFSGKKVIPFMTNAGWPGTVIQDMTEFAENSHGKVVCPMEIKFDSNGGDHLETSTKKIDSWIKSIQKECE